MVAELNEIPCGWPLGLENMNMRLQVMETLQATSMEQNSYYVHSSSSSPISSSDFDTESTRSFFPGHSITLGRLIGIKPGDRALHLPNSNLNKEHDQNSMVRVSSHASSRSRVEVSQGICMPLLLNVLVKISPSRGNSRW
ncbi:hypothetical protein AAC387_Pa12g1929 [Persea americana]